MLQLFKLSASSASMWKYRDRMLDCLLKGIYTDCTFLVGPEGETPQKIHAIKAVLMIASPYMRNLFNGKWSQQDAPIRVSICTAETFHHVMAFAHTCCLLPHGIDGEGLADVMLAADFFLMDELVSVCAGHLNHRLGVESIWPVLSKLLQNPNLEIIASACAPIIQQHTVTCLSHPSFLSASERSVIYLLQQQTLNLPGEYELVQYCIAWAMTNGGMKSLRKLLPYLRLLTMDSQDVASLPDFFQGEELGFILKYTITKKLPRSGIPPQLCTSTTPRHFTAPRQFQNPDVRKKEILQKIYLSLKSK